MKIASIFGSNMVLQRNKRIRLWGWGNPGQVISGSLVTDEGKEKVTRSVGEDGEWSLDFEPKRAQKGVRLSIESDGETILFDQIKIGEVWLAGGQSNMAYPLRYDSEKERVYQSEDFPEIYYYDCPKISFEGEEDLYDYSYAGFWRSTTQEDLDYFSALAYYFAEDLALDLDIAIGIIGCNWDGTLAASWIHPSYLEDNGGKVWLEWYEDMTKNLDMDRYKKDFLSNPENDHEDPVKKGRDKLVFPGLTKEEQDEYMNLQSMDALMEGFAKMIGPYSSQRPGGLYDTMLSKVAPYSIGGVIWYQGESDSRLPDVYDQVLGGLIQCWRDLWEDEIPFLLVQLAPFERWLFADGDNFPIIRKQQEAVAKSMDKVWLASSSDAGMQWDIHPKSKRKIGQRLALLAKEHVYGKEICSDPPELQSLDRVEEGILVSFSNARTLKVVGQDIKGFQAFGSNNQELAVKAELIPPNQVLIRCKYKEDIRLCFARTPYYCVNLYNEWDNPVKPFECNI